MAELSVLFDKDLDGNGEAGICISQIVNGKTCILKMELGEQANILYFLLTEQMTKAEIKKSEKAANLSKVTNNITEIFDKMADDVNKLKKVSDGTKVYVSINEVFDIIDKYRK